MDIATTNRIYGIADELDGARECATGVCPISMCPMTDPVVTADGHKYDRASIQAWFRTGKTTSPLTGLPLENLDLVPDLPSVDADRVPQIPSGDVDDGPNALTDIAKLLSGVQTTPLEIDLHGRVFGVSKWMRRISVRGSVTIRNGTLAVDVDVHSGGHLTLESVDVLRDPDTRHACSCLMIEGAVIARTCKFDGCIAHVRDGGKVTMTDCVIARAPGETGINVFDRDSEAICIRCCFNANPGRAVFLSDGGAITLKDCVTDRTWTVLYVDDYDRVIGRGPVRVDTCEFSDRRDRRGPLGPAYAEIVVRSLATEATSSIRRDVLTFFDDGPKTLIDLVELLSVAPVEIDLRGRILGGSKTVRRIFVRGSVTVRNGTLAVDVNVVRGGHLTLESVNVRRDPSTHKACSCLAIDGTVTVRTCEFDGCLVHVRHGGTLAMTDCVIARAPGETGINVFDLGSEATCTRCCFNANEGRAVYLSDGGAITLKDCVTDQTGSALYVDDDPMNRVIRRGTVVRVTTFEFGDRRDRRRCLTTEATCSMRRDFRINLDDHRVGTSSSEDDARAMPKYRALNFLRNLFSRKK